ncbi:MAG: DUF930 domain-containing protein [Devosia sp.]
MKLVAHETMTDVLPIALPLADPPRRDRRIVPWAAVSVAAHVIVLSFLLLPRGPLPPVELASIDVELVSKIMSSEAMSSSEPPVPSSQPETSEDAASAEMPSGVQSSEMPTAPDASTSQAGASAEPSAAASAEPAQEPSTEPAAEQVAEATPPPPPPAMPHMRPMPIPVGPGAEPSESELAGDPSAAPEESSAEARAIPDNGGDTAVAIADEAAAAPPPIDKGLLQASKRFYLDAMLDSQGMANAREALAKMAPEKRLARICNIEAIGQIGNAGADLTPDALVANAFAEPAVGGAHFGASNGAVRSKGKWYSVAYECSLSTDLSEVTAFAFHVGSDVTAAMEARIGAKPR